jgi:hypothetical protein
MHLSPVKAIKKHCLEFFSVSKWEAFEYIILGCQYNLLDLKKNLTGN